MVLALTMSFGVALAEDEGPLVDPVPLPDYHPGDDAIADLMASYSIDCYEKIDNWDTIDPNGLHLLGPNDTVEVTITAAADLKSFDWESNVPIQAVVVKAKDAQMYYYYGYGEPVTSDSGLAAPDGKAVSHVVFGWLCDDDNGSGDPQEVPIPGLNTWGTLAGVLVIGATGTFLVYRKRTATA